MKAWQWKWIFWQVFAPIAGPILVSGLVASMWWTGQPDFSLNWRLLIDDVTPWALTFYAITLIGATMNDFWPKLPEHPVLGAALIVTALAITIYGAFIVIWRHNTHFAPGPAVYVVTFMLLGISIGLCYKGAKLS
jgi:hypothetical protein